MSKVAPLPYDDRTVYSVASFNRGVAQWLGRLPTVWVEGEVTELRRHARWASVFLTLKDPTDGSCVGVTMPRGQFDGLRLELADGERVHVYGRPELFERRGDFRLRALTIERFGIGAHLAALERLKTKLAAEGLFAAERKRPLPFLPRRIGVVTGNDAAAKRDVITTIQTRFPPANVLVAETYVQGLRAAPRLALERESRRLEQARERLHRAPALAVERKRAALESVAGKLRVLSPLQTLERGYSIVRTESGVVRSASDVAPGVRVEVALADGGFGARVEDTHG